MNQEIEADYLPTEEVLIGLSGPVIPQKPEEPRSGKWPTFLRNFLAKHKECMGCGRKAQTAHHCKPFHLFPALELDENNVVPVCIPCHFGVCHAGDWKLYVESVKTQLTAHREIVQKAEASWHG